MVAILGDFALESEKLRSSRKLLLFRMQSMINNQLSNEEANFLYSNLLAISGKGGYEMTRLLIRSSPRGDLPSYFLRSTIPPIKIYSPKR